MCPYQWNQQHARPRCLGSNGIAPVRSNSFDRVERCERRASVCFSRRASSRGALPDLVTLNSPPRERMAAGAKALEHEVILMKTHPPDEFRRGTASGETVGEWAWDGRQEIRGTGGRTREGVWVGISKSGLAMPTRKRPEGNHLPAAIPGISAVSCYCRTALIDATIGSLLALSASRWALDFMVSRSNASDPVFTAAR